MRYTYTMLAIMATSLAVSACGATIGDDTPMPCETAGCKCARTLGADLDTSCASDLECGDGQWCMVTCSAFHAVEPAGFCAPLRPAGAYCSHVGGDHECASSVCDPSQDVCVDGPPAHSTDGTCSTRGQSCAGKTGPGVCGGHTIDSGPLVFPICIDIASICTACGNANESTCGECIGVDDGASCNWCGAPGKCSADVCYPVEAP